jgi:hypothetical protein
MFNGLQLSERIVFRFEGHRGVTLRSDKLCFTGQGICTITQFDNYFQPLTNLHAR